MPESKAELLTSVNEAAGLVQKVFFTYLLVSLYLAVLIGSTTHEQMLRESGVQLPLFGVGLSVFWVYAVAPWLYLALHVNLLVQHYLLSRKLHAFSHTLETLSTEKEAAEWRVRLYPSMFTQMLAGAERRYFKRFVLCSIVFLTLVVAPVVLLLWMQIRFLPYHSELVTWGNRLALIVDLALLWYYWPLMMSDEDASWWRSVTHERPLLRSSGCTILSFGVLLVSLFVAVVPGGFVERRTVETADDWWLVAAACDNAEDQRQRTSSAGEDEEQRILASFLERIAPHKCMRDGLRSCLVRHLDVREVELLAEEPPPELLAALVTDDNNTGESEDTEKTLRERTIGLDLEGRDLRGALLREANLTKVDLSNARLNGACLSGATLTGAILSGAVLHDADFTDANVQDAEIGAIWTTGEQLKNLHNDGRLNLVAVSLKGARLIGADLSHVQMDGADLQGAQLQVANLRAVKLRGANLRGADLSGANLQGAELQGADLSEATLRGVDLRKASVAGAIFTGAELSHANLREMEHKPLGLEANEILEQLANLERPEARAAHGRLRTDRGIALDFSNAKGTSVLCGEVLAENNSTKCLDENKQTTIRAYADGVVDRVLTPLLCDEEQFNPPASEAERLAMLNALPKPPNVFVVSGSHSRPLKELLASKESADLDSEKRLTHQEGGVEITRLIRLRLLQELDACDGRWSAEQWKLIQEELAITRASA